MSEIGAGLFLLALGLPAALVPAPIARFSERTDAIGSKRSWLQVEPTAWKVRLTRATGIVFAIGGLLLLLA